MRYVPAAVAACILAAGAVLHTASPVFWRVSTQQDFLRGEVEQLSIDADGLLLLGPATDSVYESTAPFLWTLIEDARGALWAGTGNDGRLIRIDRGGAAADVLDTEELEIHAVAAGADGSVYAASSPDGRIYRVAPDGTTATYADVDDKYIWALTVGADGTLYAATGERGRIYRVPPGGAAEVFYDTRAAHVLSLAFDPQDRLVAATGSPGRVFRVDRDGRGFVLLDSAYTEVRSLRWGPDEALYATALSPAPGGPPTGQPRQTTEAAASAVPSVTVSTEVTAVVIADQAAPAAPIEGQGRPPQGPLRGAVYRIAADGVWDIVWQSNEDMPYDLAFADGGALIVGTGGDGKVYRVTTDPPRTILLTKAPAKQITTVIPAAQGGYYLATANPGKILRVAATRAREGTYQSNVRDARTVATWGTVRWNAITPPGTRIQLFTRSGNTDTPDDTWSPWSRAYTNADGERIESPKARYLQWKAVLSGTDASPTLVSVTAAYLPRNLRPEIASLTVQPPGIVFQQPFSSGDPPIAGLDAVADARLQGGAPARNGSQQSTLGRRAYRKGLQTIVWNARDGNDDELRYEVLYRREGETRWTSLKRELIEPIFTWDTTAVPDGVYVLKVVASDAPSNSPGTELRGEVESRPIDVDNTAPLIEFGAVDRDGGARVVTFTVRDTQTPVERVEFSVDAERWQVVYPLDGIPDSRTEQFRLRLEPAVAAPQVIIRATDRMNNTATASAPLQP